MKKILTMSAITASMLFVVGCGGGSGSSVSTVETGKAYYLDSAVSGVNYKCGSQEGITGENGEFTFEVGQSCTFYLGDIKLRDMDKALLKDGAKIVENDIKIATLLQSLDVDGNPDNGITLTPEVVEAVVATLQEDGESKLPSTPAEIEALVTSVENNVTGFGGHAVTQTQAQSHLTSTQTEVQTEATKALLAGKTFYSVDFEKDGDKEVIKLEFNANVTQMLETEVDDANDREEHTININGNKLTFSDDTDGSYTIISQADGYIYFDDRNADGSKDGIGHRLYTNKADAQAYFDSLGGGDKPSTSSLSDMVVGKTLYAVIEGYKADNDLDSIFTTTFDEEGHYIQIEDGHQTNLQYSIDGDKIKFDNSDRYLALVEKYNDYLLFNEIDSYETRKIRYYYNKEDAQAYINSLAESSHSTDAKALLAGKTFYYTDDELEDINGYYSDFFSDTVLIEKEYDRSGHILSTDAPVSISYEGSNIILSEGGSQQTCSVKGATNSVEIYCAFNGFTQILWENIADAKAHPQP